MTLSTSAKAQCQLHSIVLLWGFTSVLGKLISLDAMPLVWWRMLLVVVMLALLPRVWRGMRHMRRRELLTYAGIGCLVAIHWLAFYGAVKLANASTAAVCLAIAPLLAAFLEPWITKSRFQARELWVGIGVVPGVILLAGGLPADMYLGLCLGLLSAVFAVLFTICNKRIAGNGSPMTITAIEMAGGSLLITLLMPLFMPASAAFALPDLHDGILLLILSGACTLLPFSLLLVVLREVSAFATQIATNMEPVYAVLLAIILLGEEQQVSWLFYAGVCIIIASVLVVPLLRGKKGRGQKGRGKKAPSAAPAG